MVTSDEPSWLTLTQALAINLPRIGYTTQAAHLCHFLAHRDRYAPADQVLVQTVMEALCAKQGQLQIEALAARCGLSRRQIERHVKRLMGLSPKTLARLVRFEQIRHHLLTAPTFVPLDLAFTYGYTDQSHFVRDFKALAGLTPRAFLTLASQRSTTHFYYRPDCRPAILPLIA